MRIVLNECRREPRDLLTSRESRRTSGDIYCGPQILNSPLRCMRLIKYSMPS
jgi:hypothetical protein